MIGTPRLRLRALRERHALSQRALAERSGVDHKTVSAAETGRRAPQPRTLRALAEALDVEPEELWMTADEEAGRAPVAVPATRAARKDERERLLFAGVRRIGRGNLL